MTTFSRPIAGREHEQAADRDVVAAGHPGAPRAQVDEREADHAANHLHLRVVGRPLDLVRGEQQHAVRFWQSGHGDSPARARSAPVDADSRVAPYVAVPHARSCVEADLCARSIPRTRNVRPPGRPGDAISCSRMNFHFQYLFS
ncbi:MAG: hypothetical protein ACRDLN_03070 [Solirubrobacteraceae bacterium]